MIGTVSFHPVDLALFDELIAPLIAGRRVNPEPFLAEAIRLRHSHWRSRRYMRALETILAEAKPPELAPGASLLQSLKAQVERFDFKLDETTRRVVKATDPDLHIHGRPFFITEGSAERVADLVQEHRSASSVTSVDDLALEQLVRLDAALAKSIEPEDGRDLSADLSHRGDLLEAMKDIHDLARAAREGALWTRGDPPFPTALEVLQNELPWRALSVHAKVVPFWIARDIDGLETICHAAGIPSPDCLVPAYRLLAEACEEFPGLKGSFGLELGSPRSIGAFVPPAEVLRILDFLTTQGTSIIRAATRQGEGPACATLLRKIKECATYASRHGYGYLEASGIHPPDLEE